MQCHRHWHLTGFSEYALIDSSGTVVREGYKNGLCLMDVICGRQRYTCQDQGLSSGCGDIYDHKLNCQWIDITGLDLDQTYTFRWTANEERVISETDYTNNVVEVQVHPASVRRGHVYGAVAPNQCPLEGGEAQSVFMTTGSLTPGEPVNYEAYETPRERRRRERRQRRERRRNRFSD
uniref:SRCR domain-containing protein n=1 Tax=Chromera velia CCMP2878 TaxID=1169474 RepID=A0A0G4HQL3_9ALVE|eukprot:Cvel_30285.t1-p1 / transcript=Cvel_30285.t1 / gene=Cvel_30285 / organism=Chromera_velia_CCMP2878 / gene_product=Lysyl oxidase homolog 2B, putative / transcript_product=Lysyl oxidase homolog 2B, putative / location=Cvel_scaffold4293:159-1817(+) / protein_length=177 / sequence_SO=supercontig / SO=protein_coding / is_pseudo=false